MYYLQLLLLIMITHIHISWRKRKRRTPPPPPKSKRLNTIAELGKEDSTSNNINTDNNM